MVPPGKFFGFRESMRVRSKPLQNKNKPTLLNLHSKFMNRKNPSQKPSHPLIKEESVRGSRKLINQCSFKTKVVVIITSRLLSRKNDWISGDISTCLLSRKRGYRSEFTTTAQKDSTNIEITLIFLLSSREISSQVNIFKTQFALFLYCFKRKVPKIIPNYYRSSQ